MRSVRRRGQPSPLVMAMAERQLIDRMPGVIMIVRRGAEPVEDPDSLDISYENATVYEGRATLQLETSGLVDDGDELAVKVSGRVVIPYSVGGQVIQPIAEDVIRVVAHPDALFTNAVLRIKGMSRAGHLALQRVLDVDGEAPGKGWADTTVHPVIETEDP